jgi:hypothetical protein
VVAIFAAFGAPIPRRRRSRGRVKLQSRVGVWPGPRMNPLRLELTSTCTTNETRVSDDLGIRSPAVLELFDGQLYSWVVLLTSGQRSI